MILLFSFLNPYVSKIYNILCFGIKYDSIFTIFLLLEMFMCYLAIRNSSGIIN